MLQKEFEERVGHAVTSEQYDTINVLYMESPLDKDQWCKEYKKCEKSEVFKDAMGLVERMTNTIATLDRMSQEFTEKYKSLEADAEELRDAKSKLDAAACIMVGQYIETQNINLRDAVIGIWGEKEYLMIMLRAGHELSTFDRELAMKYIG